MAASAATTCAGAIHGPRQTARETPRRRALRPRRPQIVVISDSKRLACKRGLTFTELVAVRPN